MVTITNFWQTVQPKKAGIYYLVALRTPLGITYDILSWVSNPAGYNWEGMEDNVVAHVRLGDVLKKLTGMESPLEDKKAIGPLKWLSGEPPKDKKILAALPYEYDLVEWDQELGWPSYINSIVGYLVIDELLDIVAQELPFSL